VPRWNTTTIIAGVDFSTCRARILDPQNVARNYVGSNGEPAAEGTPHPQRVNTGRYKGRKFGVIFDAAISADDLAALLAAVDDAAAAQTPFRVQMENALMVIDALAWPDEDAGFFTEGDESEGMVEGVSLRFLGVGPYVP
jgi:hypothetical protein